MKETSGLRETIAIRKDVWNCVEGLSEAQLNEQIEKGKWTIAQVLEHLYLMEQTIVANATQAMKQEGDHPTSSKPFQITLDRSRKADAPPPLIPSSGFITKAEVAKKLNESRESLIRLVSGRSKSELEQKSFSHPIFGLMDINQWITFIGVHEQRHLAQIQELKARLSELQSQ